jgi:hypothetical protein
MLLHDGSQPTFLAPPHLYSTFFKCFLPLIFPYYIPIFFLQTQPHNQFLTFISFYYHAHTNKNWVPNISVI